MRIRPVLLAAAALATAVPAGVSPTRAQTAGCNESSWVAGSVDLCAGTLVYRDYVYDDYGADDPGVPQSAQSRTGSLSSTAGDARYATDVNSADLVELRLRIDGDRLVATFELNALTRPTSTTAALAIDTDDNQSTGGGQWGALDVSSKGWEVLATFAEGNPETNTITGSIPLPSGNRWRVQALTAVTAGPIMNVAFRGTNEQTVTGTFWDDKQAAALARKDISEFGAAVDVAEMRTGVTRPAPLEPGFHQRVYTSKYTLPPGEGMSYTPKYGRHGNTGNVCEQAFHFFGKYQPYGIYIPKKPGPHGMQLALHGCNANHASLVDQPGMQNNVGEALNRIVVVPLGRGPVGYYSDISERDVLDVMADVERTYQVDRVKVFAGGYSMGGYGTYRMAMLYPDRFAGYVNWVGFTGDCLNNPVTASPPASCASGAIGNVIDFVRNLRHVPGAMLYAGADELVHASSAAAMLSAFQKQAGVPYIWYMHPAAEHLTFAVVDDWKKEAAYTKDLQLVTRPARVTYRTDASLAFPEWDVVHDRAYWVSAIRAAGAGYSDVDLTTAACGGTVDTHQGGQTAGPDPLPWVADLRRTTGRTPVQQQAALEGSLANVASLAVDAAATCLADGEVSYKITTNGPATVSFTDGRVLHLAAAGTHEGVLAASGGVRGAGAGRAAGAETLPATGGGSPLSPAAVAAASAAALAGLGAGRRLRSAPRA